MRTFNTDYQQVFHIFSPLCSSADRIYKIVTPVIHCLGTQALSVGINRWLAYDDVILKACSGNHM